LSQENVAVVQRGWDAFASGDLAVARELMAADVEFDVSRDIWGAVVGGGVYTGPEGIAAWLGDLYSAWESFEMAVEEVLDAGADRVISVLHARGRGRASGIELEHRPAGVATVLDGKVTRVVWYPSREDALRSLS
jgi:ketosteroid isomerase-like protein